MVLGLSLGTYLNSIFYTWGLGTVSFSKPVPVWISRLWSSLSLLLANQPTLSWAISFLLFNPGQIYPITTNTHYYNLFRVSSAAQKENNLPSESHEPALPVPVSIRIGWWEWEHGQSHSHVVMHSIKQNQLPQRGSSSPVTPKKILQGYL